MTLEEYIEVCNKYYDYLVLNPNNKCYYINYGERPLIDADYQITNFVYDNEREDGFGEVYPHCHFVDSYIVSALKPFLAEIRKNAYIESSISGKYSQVPDIILTDFGFLNS